MKRRTLCLLMGGLLLLTCCAGCKKDDAGHGADDPVPGEEGAPPELGAASGALTVDRLMSLIGKTETDLTTMMGEDAVTSDESGSRTYRKTMYGGDAKVHFVQDGDRHVQTVEVEVAKADDGEWRRELKKRCGDDQDGVWLGGDCRISAAEHGDTVTYTITKAG